MGAGCRVFDVPHLPLDSCLTFSPLYLLLYLLLDFIYLCFILLIQCFCENIKDQALYAEDRMPGITIPDFQATPLNNLNPPPPNGGSLSLILSEQKKKN